MSLTKEHRVIAAYFPIQPRWHTPDGTLWIGDPVRQYPKRGLYNNTTDLDTIRFDFENMKKNGISVVNVYLFKDFPDVVNLLEEINHIGNKIGLFWTPTFENFTNSVEKTVDVCAQVIKHFGVSALFRDFDGDYVFFWYTGSWGADTVAYGVEKLRKEVNSAVNIYVDRNGNGKSGPNQNGTGKELADQWLSDSDLVGFGKRRVQGFYCWVSVFWALRQRDIRSHVILDMKNNAHKHGFKPVICTTRHHFFASTDGRCNQTRKS